MKTKETNKEKEMRKKKKRKERRKKKKRKIKEKRKRGKEKVNKEVCGSFKYYAWLPSFGVNCILTPFILFSSP